MAVAGLVEVLWPRGTNWRGLPVMHLVLMHYFFDASFHHAKVLFRVDTLGLGLVVSVLNLTDIALRRLVGLKAVVDAG